MSFDDDDRDDRSFLSSSSPNTLNSRIMLTAIVSLTFVVILVIILHIYTRCVLRRQARRRAAAVRTLSMTIDHANAGEPPKTGLDPTVIASLPVFAFKKPDDQDDATSTECAVCLSVLVEDQMVRLLPNCKHNFHVDCVDKWLLSHSTCPICRTEAEPRVLQPESREGPSSGTAAPPSAPPLNRMEGNPSTSSNSGGAVESSGKIVNGPSSSSRLSSFRRMLSRSSSRRHQSSGQEVDQVEDLERQ